MGNRNDSGPRFSLLNRDQCTQVGTHHCHCFGDFLIQALMVSSLSSLGSETKAWGPLGYMFLNDTNVRFNVQ